MKESRIEVYAVNESRRYIVFSILSGGHVHVFDTAAKPINFGFSMTQRMRTTEARNRLIELRKKVPNVKRVTAFPLTWERGPRTFNSGNAMFTAEQIKKLLTITK